MCGSHMVHTQSKVNPAMGKATRLAEGDEVEENGDGMKIRQVKK